MASKKYLSDYAFRDPENKKSGFDYVGQYYYRIAPDRESFRRLKRRYFLFLGAEAVLYAASGALSNPGLLTFYEALPYAVNFLPVFLSLVAVIDIAFSPLDMTRKASDISVNRLKNCTIASFILAVICAFSSLGFLLFMAEDGFAWREICFLALQLLLALAAYGFMGQQGKAGVTKIPNPAYDERPEESKKNLS